MKRCAKEWRLAVLLSLWSFIALTETGMGQAVGKERAGSPLEVPFSGWTARLGCFNDPVWKDKYRKFEKQIPEFRKEMSQWLQSDWVADLDRRMGWLPPSTDAADRNPQEDPFKACYSYLKDLVQQMSGLFQELPKRLTAQMGRIPGLVLPASKSAAKNQKKIRNELCKSGQLENLSEALSDLRVLKSSVASLFGSERSKRMIPLCQYTLYGVLPRWTEMTRATSRLLRFDETLDFALEKSDPIREMMERQVELLKETGEAYCSKDKETLGKVRLDANWEVLLERMRVLVAQAEEISKRGTFFLDSVSEFYEQMVLSSSESGVVPSLRIKAKNSLNSDPFSARKRRLRIEMPQPPTVQICRATFDSDLGESIGLDSENLKISGGPVIQVPTQSASPGPISDAVDSGLSESKPSPKSAAPIEAEVNADAGN